MTGRAARTRICGEDVARLAFGTMRLAGEGPGTIRACLEAARGAPMP